MAGALFEEAALSPAWLLLLLCVASMQVTCVVSLWREAYRTRLSFLRSIVSEAFLWRKREPLDPDAEERIDDLLKEIRLQLAQASAVVAWILGCIACVSVQAQLLFVPKSIAPRAAVWPRVCLMAVLSGLGLFPKCFLQDRWLPLVHVLSILFLSAVAASPVQEEFLAPQNMFVLVTSLIFSGLCLRFWILVSSHFLLMAVAMAAIVLRGGTGDQWVAPALFTELFVFLVKVGIFVLAAIVLRSFAVKHVSSCSERCQRSAVTSLLDMMCDAVIDMDGHMLMKGHTPRFAGMLMHGPGKSLSGEPFASFVCEEDRERISESLFKWTVHDDGAPMPSMQTVLLRDAIGNRIKSLIYHVPYPSVAGRVHHLVGLREDSDTFADASCMLCAELKPDLATRLQQRSHPPPTYELMPASGKLPPQRSTAPFVATAIIFLKERLPIRTVADGFLEDFGVDQGSGSSCSGEGSSYFGDTLSDDGSALLQCIEEKIQQAQASDHEGSVVLCLGDWELRRKRRGEQARTVLRSISLFFTMPMPMPDPGSPPHVGICVKRALGSTTSEKPDMNSSMVFMPPASDGAANVSL